MIVSFTILTCWDWYFFAFWIWEDEFLGICCIAQCSCMAGLTRWDCTEFGYGSDGVDFRWISNEYNGHRRFRDIYHPSHKTSRVFSVVQASRSLQPIFSRVHCSSEASRVPCSGVDLLDALLYRLHTVLIGWLDDTNAQRGMDKPEKPVQPRLTLLTRRLSTRNPRGWD